ncbi:MAG: FMN-binding glutamate synthase family protein [Thermodesulfobacteriota bacterium]
MRKSFIVVSAVTVVVVAILSYLWWLPLLWIMVVVGPLIAMGFYDLLQTRHAIRRNFPLIGRARYVMEWFRPKIYQYFVESDIDGTPFNRMFRSIVYQRAKCELDTNPYGTRMDIYRVGYEWMNHSLNPLDVSTLNHEPRVTIGGPDCAKPYSASLLNISAMSFGALSKNAVLALNHGAKLGGFAHNTGEGGISCYHLEPGGDLIWQIGTGYFGCRESDGAFSPRLFKEKATHDNVKMIEIKLSQGAKPGHGGILPARKNTPEIAKIRGIEPYTDVISPPSHRAFSTPVEMLEFIRELRDLSGGKPVGFKLCIGVESEFLAICEAMIETGIKPDFITVDGGEGGTGAAPLEFSNSMGMPFREGLAFVYDALVGYELKDDIKIIASGKIISAFHVVRALALGADLCNSARAMMMALGCIQSLECNKNSCPTGVATQDSSLMKGLVVEDKMKRVASFHRETLKSLVELLAASGLDGPEKVARAHVYRRVSMREILRYDQLYPVTPPGCLSRNECPVRFEVHMKEIGKE